NDGMGHYTVINEITNDTIKLADPSLGNIEMNIEKFAKYVPKKYWCYFAYHPPFKKVRAYIGKDHRIHYIEYDV
ncbi:cysteine peptidase family C39 domain-containing protein, partial [Methanothermobacter sp.]|uniref:cysteine peptidase family C39 domain-containing protein n=1 Tax=Methanothermobacter sp. TaxID=1884223 RepID=UPI003C743136